MLPALDELVSLHPTKAWSDERLLEECLRGNQEAWNCLVEKYKGLIYSVPVRFGLNPDDSSEVFQDVCISLLAEMETLRQPKALPSWLMHTAWHKCQHHVRRQRRWVELGPDTGGQSASPEPDAELVFREVESSQALREAVAQLPKRCVALVRMLFYDTPPLAYQEAASRLGLATGSIGFIRGRCLQKLRDHLEQKGFR